MKNIHVLPTDKPTILFVNNEKLLLAIGFAVGTKKNKGQNIYITSDEYIGLSYYLDGNLVRKGVVDDKDYWEVRKDYKKIILTTDQDLIKDGVQAIDDEFLEWFVKNPSCESVEVRKIEDEIISPKNPKIRFNALQDPPSFISAKSLNDMILTYKYKIIFPKEIGFKVENGKRTETFYSKEENDYSALLQPVGTKQSAVEWLIETHFGSIENCTPDFRNKIKQAKEMEKQQQGYSEEDMQSFALQCVANFLSNTKNEVEISLVEVIIDRNNEQFEKFKKEQLKKK
jgi:hypothetical protein